MARNRFDVDETLEAPLNFKNLKKVMVYVARCKGRMLSALLLSGVGSVIGLTGPMLIQYAMDYSIPQGNVDQLIKLSILLGVTILINVLFTAIRRIVVAQAAQTMVHDIRRDLFAHQEQAGIHNPYEQERREQDAIRHGDEAALNRSISETYEGKIGQLAKDPLRHHKNVRTAVEAGVSVEKSFTMADSMIQQIEEIDNVTEVEAFKRMAQRMYADVVAEELQANEGGYKNPLIAAVKDYIFQHFHDSIQITDIAKYLKVNPDYLSHLFKEQEHITIKRYILQEKIRRSRNLLQYSDYSIQEISFYLGFSSQSHFCKVFQEITGETPGHYKRQFANRKKWKIQ